MPRLRNSFARIGSVLVLAVLLLVGSPQLEAKKSLPKEPDLAIDTARIAASLRAQSRRFNAGDCALVEGCVGGAGRRHLLQFDVAIVNVGTEDLALDKPKNAPELFEFSPCHGHFHFSGLAKYELFDALAGASAPVVASRKQAFCLEDTEPYAPDAGKAKYTCSKPGISMGWADVYHSDLDCQWLDITDVLPGPYVLVVTVNPDGVLPESNFENNIGEVPLLLNGDGSVDVVVP